MSAVLEQLTVMKTIVEEPVQIGISIMSIEVSEIFPVTTAMKTLIKKGRNL